jgi:CarboxypepD_reg-like domain
MEIMKRLTIMILLLAGALRLAAQGTSVSGTIVDQRGVSIVGVTVCQKNTSNCTVADRNGMFHLVLEADKEMKLRVECLGFNPVEITLSEATTYPLKVTLVPMYLSQDIYAGDYTGEETTIATMRWTVNIDALATDFSEFSTSIGSYNTDIMEKFRVIGPELGVSFSRIYAGIGIGFGYGRKHDYDSLVLDQNNTSYYFNFGYDIIKATRVRLTPLLSVRWLRSKLLNYAKEDKIPMSQYLDERDLDMRFNQTIAVAGINLECLMYNEAYVNGEYWSVGLFGGYAMKLNSEPWIYSKGNRLTSDGEIILDHLTFGMNLSFYIPVQK